MFTTLPASRAAAVRSGGWTMGSVAVHASLVALAFVLTQKVSEPEAAPVIDRLTYVSVAPAISTAAPVPSGSFSMAPPRLSVQLPILPSVATPSFDPVALALMPSELGPGLTSQPVNASPGALYTEQFVDRAVGALRSNPVPAYPARLRAANVAGEVLVRFVVDTTGRVEPNSIAILQATHPLFADAVREWLGYTRYEPAQYAGTRVRQVVQQHVGFALR